MRTEQDCGQSHTEIISGNIFIRPVTLAKAGDRVQGHTHHFDHTTILLKGAVHVRAVDPSCGCAVEQHLFAPAHLLIRAEREHEITALTDDVEFWCVYSHRNAQGEVVQVAEGYVEAYI